MNTPAEVYVTWMIYTHTQFLTFSRYFHNLKITTQTHTHTHIVVYIFLLVLTPNGITHSKKKKMSQFLPRTPLFHNVQMDRNTGVAEVSSLPGYYSQPLGEDTRAFWKLVAPPWSASCTSLILGCLSPKMERLRSFKMAGITNATALYSRRPESSERNTKRSIFTNCIFEERHL